MPRAGGGPGSPNPPFGPWVRSHSRFGRWWGAREFGKATLSISRRSCSSLGGEWSLFHHSGSSQFPLACPTHLTRAPLGGQQVESLWALLLRYCGPWISRGPSRPGTAGACAPAWPCLSLGQDNSCLPVGGATGSPGDVLAYSREKKKNNPITPSQVLSEIIFHPGNLKPLDKLPKEGFVNSEQILLVSLWLQARKIID